MLMELLLAFGEGRISGLQVIVAVMDETLGLLAMLSVMIAMVMMLLFRKFVCLPTLDKALQVAVLSLETGDNFVLLFLSQDLFLQLCLKPGLVMRFNSLNSAGVIFL